MQIRQWAVRTWWRAKRALVRGLDRRLGTDMIPPADVLHMEVGRSLTVHVLTDHERTGSMQLIAGDSFDITLRTATASGFQVPEPMVLIIDGFSPVNAPDPYADRRR